MALKQCPQCGKTVSDKAYACPHCGYAMHQSGDSVPGYAENAPYNAQSQPQSYQEPAVPSPHFNPNYPSQGYAQPVQQPQQPQQPVAPAAPQQSAPQSMAPQQPRRPMEQPVQQPQQPQQPVAPAAPQPSAPQSMAPQQPRRPMEQPVQQPQQPVNPEASQKPAPQQPKPRQQKLEEPVQPVQYETSHPERPVHTKPQAASRPAENPNVVQAASVETPRRVPSQSGQQDMRPSQHGQRPTPSSPGRPGTSSASHNPYSAPGQSGRPRSQSSSRPSTPGSAYRSSRSKADPEHDAGGTQMMDVTNLAHSSAGRSAKKMMDNKPNDRPTTVSNVQIVNTSRQNIWIYVLLTILAFLLGGLAVFYFMNHKQKKAEEEKVQAEMRAEERQKQAEAEAIADSVKTFTVNGVSFDMKYIPGGTFTMGASDEQLLYASSDEKPARQVTLSNYFIGTFEVTQELWKAVMGKAPQSAKKGDKYPVENVSHVEIVRFIERLRKQTQTTFNLPTEAQWEFAAREGQSEASNIFSGAMDLEQIAWYHDNSGRKVHQVGTKQPNALRLYDMSGNVWEWCCDLYAPYGNQAETNPIGPLYGEKYVLRGGSFNSIDSKCRTSARESEVEKVRRADVGFRLACPAK